MTRQLHILAPTRYPWRFNGPRHSQHDVEIRKFLPMNRFSYKLEGITVFNPFPPKRFDLIHTFNRIPLSTLPFVMGFESHMPRAYGLEHTGFYRLMAHRLAHPKCRKIVAISHYARKLFEQQHDVQPWASELLAKLEVRYPNIDIPQQPDCLPDQAEIAHGPIRLVYTGHHFGRKGGAIVVRMAELAHQLGLPIEIDFISRCVVGIESWVDPLRTDFFADDLKKLQSLPNIRHHNSLDNPTLMALLAQAHFALLPTFADTFGFSVIEAMAHHTPVITTAQGALPEFIRDEENGILLPIECNSYGDWVHMKRGDRDTPAYEQLFRSEIERLALEMLKRIQQSLQNTASYLHMRAAARQTAEELFDAHAASRYWDGIYEKALP